jgi:hypothetical protein
MNGIYLVQDIGMAFLAILGIVALVYYMSRRAGPTRTGKQKIYACGEDESPENMNVSLSGFFEQAGSVLGINHIRDAHNGDLSNYLGWILIGMLALILVMVIYW